MNANTLFLRMKETHDFLGIPIEFTESDVKSILSGGNLHPTTDKFYIYQPKIRTRALIDLKSDAVKSDYSKELFIVCGGQNYKRFLEIEGIEDLNTTIVIAGVTFAENEARDFFAFTNGIMYAIDFYRLERVITIPNEDMAS